MKGIIKNLTILICLALLSNCNSTLEEKTEKKYFTDYDFFSQKGVIKLDKADLEYPYFEQNQITDSTILLTLHNGFWSKEKIEVPKRDKVIYNFFDINDGPKHYFSKLTGDKLIRYGYNLHPKEILNSKEVLPFHNLIPSSIEIITRDTFYLYSYHCFFNEDINTMIPINEISQKIILPFEVNESDISKNCHHFCYYYKENGELWEYNRDTNKHVKSDGGLYGFKSPFKNWKPFYNINRWL